MTTSVALPRAGGAQAPGRVQVRNLMPAFWRVYDEGKALPDLHQRGLLIGKQFLLPNAEVFTAAGFNGGSHGRFYDDRVAAWLGQLDVIAPAVRSLSESAPGHWLLVEQKFRHHFPDYRTAGSVWFLVSLFSFNGYTQQWQGQPMLFIGTDGIVHQQGANANLDVLFSHELFHLYHSQVTSTAEQAETIPLRLWREGMASYVSCVLNPSAELSDVLLSSELARMDAATIGLAARETLKSIATNDLSASHRLFDLDFRGPLPPRMGYLLGFRVAAAAAQHREMTSLARLTAKEIEKTVATELQRLVGVGRDRTRTGSVSVAPGV